MKGHRDFNLRRKARPLSAECLARILRETTTEKDAAETYERLTGKKSQKIRKEIEMKLLIEIPTEFESHFNLDRFKDSLKRLEFDANYLAGKYEKELAEMLIESFQNAQIQAEEPFDTKYPTWIVAFCPDINSFFVTNERHFFWESEEEFDSEEAGIYYFEHQTQRFMNVANQMVYTERIWLENTQKWYI